jgi:hypothetical protein
MGSRIVIAAQTASARQNQCWRLVAAQMATNACRAATLAMMAHSAWKWPLRNEYGIARWPQQRRYAKA